MNLFTYGRSVTLVMQTMKNTDPEFTAWYAPHKKWLANDPLMTYFNKTRTDILHGGELDTPNFTRFGGKTGQPVDMGRVKRYLDAHAPPNTIGTFLGDTLGGDGWIVQQPDGSTARVYFQLPDDVDIRSGLMLKDPPSQHDGHTITDTSIANLGRIYIEALDRLVTEFADRFGEPKGL
jgi:hypothetical protein